ncbi:MAG: tetratricopeptide repeat protein, partial [Blastocatellia bacterium]
GSTASSNGPSNTTASNRTASNTTAGASGSVDSSTSAANRPSPPEPVTTIITTAPASKPRPTPGAGRTVSDEHAPTDVRAAEEPNPNRPGAAHPVEKTPVAPPGPPSVAPVSGVQPSPTEASSTGAVTSTASGPAPSPLIHEMEAALASGRLVEPAGYSAWDIYQKLNRVEPYPAQMADLRSGLVEALLKQSTQILSADATLDMVSVHMDDFKLAGRMLGALREIDSSQPNLPLLQKLAAVDALIALQFYDEAEQSLGPLKDSPSASVQNSFGLMYKGQYDDWRAERSFKRATELDPKWATPHYNLGLIYEAQNKPEALTEFEQAGTLDPSNARFQEALGDEYFHGQQWAKAADSYRKAIASNPGFDALHTKLGHALYSEGLRDEADKEYKRALELSGKH